jgi:hypothetical protein
MSQNRKLQNSLTAAALATLITLGGGSAALASNYSLDKHNNSGSSTSQTSEQQKTRSEKSGSLEKKQKAQPNRESKKKFDKAKSVQKSANAEQKVALKELKAQRLLINKEFRVAVQKANLTLENKLLDLTLPEAEIDLANLEHKEAIKSAHEKKRTAIKELKIDAKEFAKEYRVKVPKI